MALQYTLLTLLQRQPQTGYEIVKAFDDAVGFFWQATHQQVYRELSKLSDSGLVKFKEIKQADKPDKKLYRISANGSKALREWVETPLRTMPNKHPLLVKLQNTDADNISSIREELANEKTKGLALQQTYQHIEQQYYTRKQLQQMPAQDQMLYIALRKGIHSMKAHLNWLDETNQLLDNLFSENRDGK